MKSVSQAETREETIQFDEEGMKALETLVEVAVYLKESGILDLLRVVAERSGELLTIIANDPALHRVSALADGATRGITRLKPEEVISVKQNIEKLTECTLRSMAAVNPADVKPVGLFGMLGALRDRDVQRGLGLLLAIAKNLGACTARTK
ncbi:hypothetical protein Pyrde_1864 [Pyrodictium delaneyi]|uniref:DUF1641 domain-containing protein n=1 Tax=Pyrodictium delaneyi TaxID=1273541 RepID=A0A0P0N6H8_9CREN|nr:hypothetical protein Pyrde_1864 [Pyrodictium delaneyi]